MSTVYVSILYTAGESLSSHINTFFTFHSEVLREYNVILYHKEFYENSELPSCYEIMLCLENGSFDFLHPGSGHGCVFQNIMYRGWAING